MASQVTIVGGGFAGCEAAWACAQRGAEVTLYEMRPVRTTPVHHTGLLAELVCSNSLKSGLLTNASGVLKEEMRRLGSLIVPAAERNRVPAGEALAVDRDAFAQEITASVESHPNIRVVRQEITAIPTQRPLVLATGPLTSESLARAMSVLTGGASLSFYDAVAPTVTLESLDLSCIFRASRRGRSLAGAEPAGAAQSCGGGAGEPGADYLNCPLTREEYMAFWEALNAAELAPLHDFEQNAPAEKMVFFEMCVPVEELARRGPRTLAFGPMRPIGLTDPRSGRRPFAVVQLRQENRAGTLWGLVGFQTRLKWGEQKRVFRMIPGLENAEFVRFGVMHRNTYVNSPRVLTSACELREHPGIFLAGQITGVEGYLESAAIGLLAGINAARSAGWLPGVTPPSETVLGSLARYLVETPEAHFAPMNSNWGIVPELEGPPIRDKREKARLKGERSLRALDQFRLELNEGSGTFSEAAPVMQP